MKYLHRALLLVTLLTVAACATTEPVTRRAPSRPGVVPVDKMAPPKSTPGVAPVDGAAPSWQKDFAPTDDEIPAGIENTPDAVPVPESKSASGNASSYEVLGRTYAVLQSAKGFKQRGYASWYGKKFHGRKTASGERYNMFAMTAAHKRLPLPTYVRVTDLGNHKSVVVKVNDRGPFHSDRIIDLSYAAAAKLGLIGHGTTRVEIEAIDPGDTAPPAPTQEPVVASVTAAPAIPVAPQRSGFLQVAAYADPINAVAMREELERIGIGPVEIHISQESAPPIHRVLVGPFRDADAAGDVRMRLDQRSMTAQWVPN